MFAMLLAGALAGCGDSQETAADKTEAVQETTTEAAAEVAEALSAAEKELVTKIAAISAAVDKAPAMAESILEKYGITSDEYEAAVYKIAENPALSDAFEKAKGN